MTFLAGLGAFVLITPVVIVLFLLMSAWWCWWLYPAWAWFVVPLGAPRISLWYFWALFVLLRARPADLKARDKNEKDWADYTGFAIGLVFGPMMTYALLWWLAGDQ